MLNWILAGVCAVLWIGAYTNYFKDDIRRWLHMQYWWQRTQRLWRK